MSFYESLLLYLYILDILFSILKQFHIIFLRTYLILYMLQVVTLLSYIVTIDKKGTIKDIS